MGSDFFDHYLRENSTLTSDMELRITAANGQSMTARGLVYVEIDIGAKKRETDLRIMEELGFKVILGTNIIYGWRMILDFKTERI